MIKLYGITQSRAFRPLWLLEELGLDYEQIALDYRGKALEAADYRALNPNGRIPTLVDGDLVLWESMAIDLYLARRYGGGAGLWPDTIEGEALAWQWSFWVMSEVEHPLLTVLMHSRVLPEEKRDAGRASRVDRLHGRIGDVETRPARGITESNVDEVYHSTKSQSIYKITQRPTQYHPQRDLYKRGGFAGEEEHYQEHAGGHRHDAVGVGIGQGADEDPIHHREDGRGGTDGHGQRGEGHQRESPRLDERAHGDHRGVEQDRVCPGEDGPGLRGGHALEHFELHVVQGVVFQGQDHSVSQLKQIV